MYNKIFKKNYSVLNFLIIAQRISLAIYSVSMFLVRFFFSLTRTSRQSRGRRLVVGSESRVTRLECSIDGELAGMTWIHTDNVSIAVRTFNGLAAITVQSSRLNTEAVGFLNVFVCWASESFIHTCIILFSIC